MGTSKPKMWSLTNFTLSSLPSRAALSSARVCWIDIRLPTPYGPPVKPVFISHTRVPFLAMFAARSLL